MPSTDDDGRSRDRADTDAGEVPVAAQALLIDPDTLAVVWMNESAARALAERGAEAEPGMSVERALPVTAALGVTGALREVAASGVPRRLRSDVIAMSRRSLALVVSIERLPDGKLLLLAEHVVQAAPGRGARGARRRR